MAEEEFTVAFNILGGSVTQVLRCRPGMTKDTLIKGLNAGTHATTLWHVQRPGYTPTVDEVGTAVPVADIVGQEVEWELWGHFSEVV